MDPAEKRARSSVYYTRLYDKRRKAGICTRCRAPAAEGKSLCETHLERSRVYEAERRKKPSNDAERAKRAAYDRAYRRRRRARERREQLLEEFRRKIEKE